MLKTTTHQSTTPTPTSSLTLPSTMACFLGHHNTLHTFIISSKTPKPIITYASLPARDRVIDFGKHKGKMLGTLPSTYLKWVSKNLRARNFEDWANLADQVLDDPVYKDRVEWEFAEKLLNGDVLNSKSESVVADLLEISQRFGWDNEDKIGWKNVDFKLLGSSKGGRIPRVKERRNGGGDCGKLRGESSNGGGDREGGFKGRRVRRERLKMKTQMRRNTGKLSNLGEEEDEESEESQEGYKYNGAEVYNPFPGRETLLRKVLNRRGIA